MVARSHNLSESLYQYMIDNSVRETEILQKLRELENDIRKDLDELEGML